MCRGISSVCSSSTPCPGDAPEFDGVKVKERFARGVSDYIDGSGTATGYAINIFLGIRGTLLGGGGSDLKSGITDPWTEGEYWFEK